MRIVVMLEFLLIGLGPLFQAKYFGHPKSSEKGCQFRH